MGGRALAALIVFALGCGRPLGGAGDAGADAAPADLAPPPAPCDAGAFKPFCDDQHRVHACYGGIVETGDYCAGSDNALPSPGVGYACVSQDLGTGQPSFYCVDPSLTPCDTATFQLRCSGNSVVRCVSSQGTGPGYTLTLPCIFDNPICVEGNGTASCTFAGSSPCDPSNPNEYCDPQNPSAILGCAATGYPSQIICVPPGPGVTCTCGPPPSCPPQMTCQVTCTPSSGPLYECAFQE